jgi:hypothetical protein
MRDGIDCDWDFLNSQLWQWEIAADLSEENSASQAVFYYRLHLKFHQSDNHPFSFRKLSTRCCIQNHGVTPVKFDLTNIAIARTIPARIAQTIVGTNWSATFRRHSAFFARFFSINSMTLILSSSLNCLKRLEGYENCLRIHHVAVPPKTMSDKARRL